nr:hypothetical protein [Rhodococcus sp. (in: high G+C Gram-positive bacteria)]
MTEDMQKVPEASAVPRHHVDIRTLANTLAVFHFLILTTPDDNTLNLSTGTKHVSLVGFHPLSQRRRDVEPTWLSTQRTKVRNKPILEHAIFDGYPYLDIDLLRKSTLQLFGNLTRSSSSLFSVDQQNY